MATLVDPEDFKKDNQPRVEAEQEEQYASLEEDNSPKAVEEPKAEAPESDLPEKYAGKSAAELAEMHANLETLLGRQSSEIGEIRKAFDQMVQENIANKKQQTAPETSASEDVDFWTDPQGAISKTIENHPSLRKAEEISSTLQKQKALDSLNAAHPDKEKILSDPKFAEWIKASPIRTDLYQRADQGFDFDSANELLSLWKERQAVAEKQQAVELVARKQEVKEASTGSGRSNPEGTKQKKVYRRRDIIELMNTNPKRYAALQDEILQAYAEGRVK
jgi:hypothetical protein